MLLVHSWVGDMTRDQSTEHAYSHDPLLAMLSSCALWDTWATPETNKERDVLECLITFSENVLFYFITTASIHRHTKLANAFYTTWSRALKWLRKLLKHNHYTFSYYCRSLRALFVFFWEISKAYYEMRSIIICSR